MLCHCSMFNCHLSFYGIKSSFLPPISPRNTPFGGYAGILRRFITHAIRKRNNREIKGGTMYSRCLWSVWFMVFLSVVPAVAGIPGVTVTVANPATNFVRTAISNEAGVYTFPSLQPGRYNIKVELPGFRTITQNDVELQVQQSARIDFTLQ